MRDLFSDIKLSQALTPQTQTNADTAFTCAIIDNQNYDSLTYAIQYGTITDTNVTFTTLLEEGDDSGLSDAAAVDDADMIGTEAGATPLFSDDLKTFKLAYKGKKRYTRLTITPSGNNSGAIPIAVLVIQGHPRTGAVTTQKT